MTEVVFIKIFNLSIIASWLVLGIIFIRVIFRRAPKNLRCVLWAMVAIRLICPFSYESITSLIPSAETIPHNVIHYAEPEINSGFSTLNDYINPKIADITKVEPGETNNLLEEFIFIVSLIWGTGVLIMLGYIFVSFLKVNNQVREAIPLKDNIKVCDKISTPFILGILNPYIFIPLSVNEIDLEFVVEHEKAHLQRHDNIWKPIGFFLLSIYWFNPIMWVAYILFCRDIELACDEKVLRKRGIKIKKAYSNALINCSVPNDSMVACPLAFGVGGVKERVKAILKYKKPSNWINVGCVMVVIAVIICFLCNPTLNNKNMNNDDYVDIKNMNIGAEMPSLIYGDENKVIFYGTCGIIIYDIKSLKISDRLSVEYLNNKGINFLYACVSEDGNSIYICDQLSVQKGDEKFIYEYDINSGKLLNHAGKTNNIFITDNLLESNYSQEYHKFIDTQNIVGERIVRRDKDFIYLQAKNDWSMKSLQIVICDYNTKETINVFDL